MLRDKETQNRMVRESGVDGVMYGCGRLGTGHRGGSICSEALWKGHQLWEGLQAVGRGRARVLSRTELELL